MTSDKQRKIDRICQWMGWHTSAAHDGAKIWRDRDEKRRATCGVFDPFTNPGHCARVMDEVTKSYDVDIHYSRRSPYLRWACWLGNDIADVCGNGNSDPEAKMNALWAAIGDGQ